MGTTRGIGIGILSGLMAVLTSACDSGGGGGSGNTVAVSAVDPPMGPSTGGTPITIIGNNFGMGQNLRVTIHGAACSEVKWVSGVKLTAKTPPLDPSNARRLGTKVEVLVQNPDGTKATGAFTYYAGMPGFGRNTYGPTGIDPVALTLLDQNGDGNLDVAVANRGGGSEPPSVTILRGDGFGTFNSLNINNFNARLPTGLARGSFTSAAAAGLPGADSRELAVIDEANSNVVVLPAQNPQQPIVNPPAGLMSPRAVCAADFDQDQKLDLAVATTISNKVRILRGLGNGSFVPIAKDPVSPTAPARIVCDDWNGDNLPDLAVAGSDKVIVVFGDGKGGFSEPLAAFPSQVDALAAVELNRAPPRDLVVGVGWMVTGLTSTGISFMKSSETALPLNMKLNGIAAADLDKDGWDDLVVTVPGENGVRPLYSTRDGKFSPMMTKLYTGLYPTAVALGDLDRDGLTDIAVINSSDEAPRRMAVLFNISQ